MMMKTTEEIQQAKLLKQQNFINQKDQTVSNTVVSVQNVNSQSYYYLNYPAGTMLLLLFICVLDLCFVIIGRELESIQL